MAPNPGDERTVRPVNETKDMKAQQGDVHPTGLKFAFLMVSVFAAMFLVSLVYLLETQNIRNVQTLY